MNYQGKTAAFYTLGCKLNFAETSAIAHTMEEAGFQKVNFEDKADVYVINTCTVTQAGDKTSRNFIRRAFRNNPDAMIVVVGCFAQLKPEEVGLIEGVDLVLGTHEKFNIPAWLGNLTKKEKTEVHITRLADLKEFHRSYSWGDRTRSFLKIQDGCDYYCTYCAIPYARGRSRNDTIKNTVAEAVKAVQKGYKEIVLTGVNIGDFGKSTGESFISLLSELEKVDGLMRLRMGSIEPDLLTDEIIDLTAQSKVIMPHFHIPLQAGSDEILGLMKRKYTTEYFASRIAKIREKLPLAFIGVDVIAGANGETEELFRESYNFLNSLEISQLHAFPYSERSGTQALKIPLKVPVKERKLRTLEYINLSDKKLRSFYQKNIGLCHSVLFEEHSPDNRMEGFTGNYIRVESLFDPVYINRPVETMLISVHSDGNVFGEIIKKNQ